MVNQASRRLAAVLVVPDARDQSADVGLGQCETVRIILSPARRALAVGIEENQAKWCRHDRQHFVDKLRGEVTEGDRIE